MNPATHGAETDGTLCEGMVIGDHFVIRRTLGRGGMGEVYLAENLNVPDKRYAIKVLRREFSSNPQFVSMLHDEAAKQSRLEHDNVVGMYDFFVWNKHYCLVQSYIDGKTLAQMIQEQPQGLRLDVALPLMRGILSGIDYANKIGILHCDVKPANVIVDKEGRPRVTDFGISRDIGGGESNRSVVGAGTAEYMSPEQILRPHEIDHRSDVYSAGILFFEMLSGSLPYELARDEAAPLPQTLHDAPDVRTRRADIPEPLARVVATALRRDTETRFQGCGDFSWAIGEVSRRERWRKTWLPAIAGSTLLAIVMAGGLYRWRESVHRDSVEAAERNRVEQQRLTVEAELAGVRAQQAAVRSTETSARFLNLLCREWIDYQIKEPILKRAVAEKMASEDKLRQYARRMDEMRTNMDAYQSSYVDAIRQLSAMETRHVETAISTFPASDAKLSRVAAWIKADHAAVKRGSAVPATAGLLARCPAPIQDGTAER